MELREWLHQNRMKISTFSRQIGYAREYITNVSNRKSIPGRHLARTISNATNGEVTIQELMLPSENKNSLSTN